MTKQSSKIVTTNQNGIHEDLIEINERYNLNYQRPISDFSHDTFKEIFRFINGSKVIFDFGCGVGASTFWLANKYPDLAIVGIDKSISRLERKNEFKKDIPANALLIRGELLDLIYLIYLERHKDKLDIHSIYILYPNPWPKKMHVKRRFHANPIAPFIYGLDCPLILRSNWKVYLEEFALVAKHYGRENIELNLVKEVENITPFEKKYNESQQLIFELVVS